MARIVDSLPPARIKSNYPWDEWFDGRAWELVKGEDFDCEVQSMRTMAYSRARERGLHAASRIVGDTLTIQATKKDAAS